jgi:hypothetical protein
MNTKTRIVLILIAVLATAQIANAQTPTPWPTPTPSVIGGEFVVIPQIDHGQRDILLMLIFIAGLQLTQILIEVAKWLRSS